MTRKWDALKQRLARDQYTKMLSCSGVDKPGSAALVAMVGAMVSGTLPKGQTLRQTWNDYLQVLAGEVYDLIMRWDVRCAGKLLELFPGCIPKNHQGRPFKAELLDNEAGDDCDWTLIW